MCVCVCAIVGVCVHVSVHLSLTTTKLDKERKAETDLEGEKKFFYNNLRNEFFSFVDIGKPWS